MSHESRTYRERRSKGPSSLRRDGKHGQVPGNREESERDSEGDRDERARKASSSEGGVSVVCGKRKLTVGPGKAVDHRDVNREA